STGDGAKQARLTEGRTRKELAKAATAVANYGEASTSTERSPVVGPPPDFPKPPFFGGRTKKDWDLREVFQYINETALFKNQWQLKTASAEDYKRLVEEKYRPILAELEEECIRDNWFDAKTVYGYFPCNSDGNSVIVYDPASVSADPVNRSNAGAKE